MTKKTARAQLADQNTRAPRMGRSVSGPYALMACSDCGALGCLIPVPHKVVPVTCQIADTVNPTP